MKLRWRAKPWLLFVLVELCCFPVPTFKPSLHFLTEGLYIKKYIIMFCVCVSVPTAVVRASMTLRILNKNFTADMADTGSDQFYTVASPYSTEVCLLVSLPVCLPACLPACLSIWLPVCQSSGLSACLSVCLPACLSVCLSVSPCAPYSSFACLVYAYFCTVLYAPWATWYVCRIVFTRLTDTWLSAFNNRQMSDAVFLGFRKAFDLVHRDILL